MDQQSLLQAILENLLDGDVTEAIYSLRSLADELEEGGVLDPDEVAEVITVLHEGM